ncbi:hypothetical protein Tco_0052486 [Tanacetum coccineum]
MMNRLNIDKFNKAYLVGPDYNLLKGTCQSCLGHLTVASEYIYNNDLAYPKLSNPEKKYTMSITKTKAILSVKSVTVNKLHDYSYLEEIVVKRADRQLYKFKEGNFVNLHLNDIKDMLLLVVQHKLFHLDGEVIVELALAMRVVYANSSNQKRLMRADELYKFLDGALKNWSATDKKKADIMVDLIEKLMLERFCHVGFEAFTVTYTYISSDDGSLDVGSPGEVSSCPTRYLTNVISPGYITESDPEEDHRTPPLLPIPLPTSSPPLLLPSTDCRADVHEVTLPPKKRLCIALGTRYKVGECSYAPTARPTRGFRAYYDEITEELPATDVVELGQMMTDFVTTVRDRRSYARTARLMESEAIASREAWVQSMDASDMARSQVIALRTTVLAQ